MTDSNPDTRQSRPVNWKRRFFVLLAGWAVLTLALSNTEFRGLIARPLFVHHPEATGQVAYVMADGPAYYERLFAASDLYHMHKVKQIAILDEQVSAGYNFIRKQSDSRNQRAIDYLTLHGVPADKIISIAELENATFGSLSEARQFAKTQPNVKSVVVVTSAPHTRRSLMCFQRSLPASVSVTSYAASPPAESWEIHSPIWIEYVKLFVYWFVA